MKPIVLLLLFVLVQGVYADAFDDGFAAYKQQDYATALALFRPLAAQGDIDAQHNIGIMYYLGQGVAPDYVQAYAWLYLASAQGHKNAYLVRERIAGNLTPEQIAEANKLAQEWMAKNK
jgi:TPR repeat protein